MLRYSIGLSRRLGMGWKQMLEVMDTEEIAHQMAYDLVEADEQQARKIGVPTPAEIHAAPPSRRLGSRDPDWFKKLSQMAGLA